MVTPTTPRLLALHSEAGAPRSWLDKVVDRIAFLASVGPGELGRHHKPLHVDTAVSALHILKILMTGSSVAPQLVLTDEGGLQLEWHQGGLDLEIEVRPIGSASALFEDLEAGEEWDGPLAEYIQEIRFLLAKRLTSSDA